MTGRDRIDPQEMADEAGLSQDQAVQALLFLINNDWLSYNQTNLDVGEGMEEQS